MRKATFALCRGLLLVLEATLLALPATAQSRGEAGRFDYYVLSLSWSPQHCATRGSGDPRQCGAGRRYGFIVHGLWPQYEEGGYPAYCRIRETPSRDTIDRIIEIMPSENLIRHEWTKHGACSGLPPSRYFDVTSQAFSRIAMPDFYRRPTGTLSRSVPQLKAELTAANPKLPASAISVACSGQYLREVRICLDKSLRPRACSPEVARSTCRGDFIVRPVR